MACENNSKWIGASTFGNQPQDYAGSYCTRNPYRIYELEDIRKGLKEDINNTLKNMSGEDFVRVTWDSIANDAKKNTDGVQNLAIGSPGVPLIGAGGLLPLLTASDITDDETCVLTIIRDTPSSTASIYLEDLLIPTKKVILTKMNSGTRNFQTFRAYLDKDTLTKTKIVASIALTVGFSIHFVKNYNCY
jgi:hypothetical protein